MLKKTSVKIRLLAVIAGALALWHFYQQQSQLLSNGHFTYDTKYGAAIEALSLLGVFAWLLADWIEKIEK